MARAVPPAARLAPLVAPLRARLRPAAPGRSRRVGERVHVIAKSVFAAALAWTFARYALRHPDPYYAPLAALFGVYPTVARSVRESAGYAAGFLVAMAVAVPIGELLGPGLAGIVLVLAVGLTLAEARWIGGQGEQIPFLALFALLFGRHDVVDYAAPRVFDVVSGLAVGLAVNALLFPPLHLRPAERAVRDLGRELALALGALADVLADRDGSWARWDERRQRLARCRDQAREACARGEDSMRANPRTRLNAHRRRGERRGAWPPPRVLACLEQVSDEVEGIGATFAEIRELPRESPDLGRIFRLRCARQLRLLARLLRSSRGRSPDRDLLDEARAGQDRLEAPHRAAGTDPPGLWDPRKELVRRTRRLLGDVRELSTRAPG
ncbi:FUSC family protein [Actinomadura atramentaria]|uniref:FUSC family protein n=1 Tax=Actinomadura atramentaria TaxID=1990 RepID=UPI000377735E|nr:FUSC family protein [Actinomadura atramentaria]